MRTRPPVSQAGTISGPCAAQSREPTEAAAGRNNGPDSGPRQGRHQGLESAYATATGRSAAPANAATALFSGWEYFKGDHVSGHP